MGLVERSSKRLVHYVTNIGQSVHSVALLPAGRVVVVSSWDNLISVFSLAEDRKLFELKSDDDGTGGEGALGFPHGVLWDDAQSAVWVAGRRGSPKRAGGEARLHRYTYRPQDTERMLAFDYGQGMPTKSARLPDLTYDSPHDICPVPGERQILFAGDYAVHRFDIASGTFHELEFEFPEGWPANKAREIKSISQHPGTKKYVLVHKDPFGSGYGKNVRFFDEQGRLIGARGTKNPSSDFYKARWFCEVPGWPTPAVPT